MYVVTVYFFTGLPQSTPSYKVVSVISGRFSGAPNENIVQNHLNIALLNVF